jgi:N-hydroxyarylamine O-acetyltransferase
MGGGVEPVALDLPAYLRRIGYAGGLEPSRATLEALHLAHATAIPFENLDILLGRPIRLDLASLQAKLVRGGRGGYCFEQNLLFAAVLEHLGFALTRLAARVRLRADRVNPRTHMTLAVAVEGERVLADVGFGVEGLLLPVPIDGAESPTTAFACCSRAARMRGAISTRSRTSRSCRSTTNCPTGTRRRIPRRGSCRR